MFSKADGSKKGELLEKAKASRNERAFQKQREQAVIKIQVKTKGAAAVRTGNYVLLCVVLFVPYCLF